MIDTLAHLPNSVTLEFELAAEAAAVGLTVHRIAADLTGWVDMPALIELAGPRVAYRGAGGPLAKAIRAGARIRLTGATPHWFVGLPDEVTGRVWALVDVAGARAMLRRAPAFVKLAAAKFRALPARRYSTVTEFDAAFAAVHAPDSLQLLATTGWLAVDSEYRVFTLRRDVVAWSPYLVQDNPWTPLLRGHRASFHDEAAAFVRDLLADLPADEVPPTAVLDVARLADGRFVVLEVNSVWSSGLYGCDPAGVLQVVVAAAGAEPGHDERWVWTPDPAAGMLHR